jgi:tetratricopeptide (TPR) repeat protein
LWNLAANYLEERMREKGRFILINTLIFVFLFGSLIFGQEDLTPDETELFKKYYALNKNFEKGKRHFAREDYKKARKEFEKLLIRMPEHADARFFLAQIDYKEGDVEKALSHIQMAREHYKFSAKMKMKMAETERVRLEEQKQELEDMCSDLEEKIISLTENVDDDEQEEVKANLQRRVENIKKQIKSIDVQLAVPISSMAEIPADYFYVNGNIYFKMKKFQEAHDQYQEAIRRDPRYGDAYNNLAALYFQVKQYQKALSYLNQAEENGAEVNPKFKEAVLKALGKD